jgi:hypothetical protein
MRQGVGHGAALRLGAALALCACAPVPEVGAEKPASELPPGSWSAIEAEIMVPRCATAACHAGETPAFYPQLDAGVARERLLELSQQVGAPMVVPGDPDASYLVRKLRGDAASVGGVGTPMPIGEETLDEAAIQAIEGWIRNGAAND